MKTLRPYLIFPGTCREALEFYAACLAGDIIEIQTYADAPMDFPAESDGRIFNSILRAGQVELMASDCLPGQSLPAGANISMFVSFGDEKEQAGVFSALCEGGKVLMPLANGFGMVQDRFEIRWMLARQD
jgi:PhnB protein